MKSFFLLSSFILLNLFASTPTYRTILDQLDNEHQQCLDEGKSMMLCSRDYSHQMDSVLNLVYKDLLTHYAKASQDNLRQQQRQWIKERDKEFKRIWDELKKENEGNPFIGQDDRMFAYEKEAEFIELRIQELITELEELKQ